MAQKEYRGGPDCLIDYLERSFPVLEAYVNGNCITIIRNGTRIGSEPHRTPTRDEALQCCEAIEHGLGALERTAYAERLAWRYAGLKKRFDGMR
jgi:hypothetical protein